MMLLGKYVYPSIFLLEDDGVTVTFPDFEYLVTCGKNVSEAIEKATECLGLGIHDMLQGHIDNRAASDPKNIKLHENEIITFISVDMDDWFQKTDNKFVRKNISLPAWMFRMAKDKKINVSEVTQKALMKELDVNQH